MDFAGPSGKGKALLTTMIATRLCRTRSSNSLLSELHVDRSGGIEKQRDKDQVEDLSISDLIGQGLWSEL
jgi:hypothetical protein